jgi:phosphate-selective porin OprO and OprP
MKWISTVALLALLGFGLSGSRAMAQQGSDPQAIDELRTRLEQQDAEIHRLQSQVNGMQTAPTEPMVGNPAPDVAKKADDAKKAEIKDYTVGTDLSIKTSLKDGLFLWFETPNKDFTMHLGAWMQYDNVFLDQTPALKTAQGTGRPVASGDLSGGIGDLNDGTYFRRIRPFVEGTFWEQGEYRLILALENNQFSTSGLDEFWVGVKDVPVIGTVRVGHVKTPMGLEGDMTASSRTMTFMERSSYSEPSELNQTFVTGVSASNNFFDQRLVCTGAIFRTDLKTSSGVFFGDDQWGVQGRMTGLPIYKDEGRELVHVGISSGWRSGNANATGSPFDVVQLNARPELRDDDPAGGGPGVVTNANSNRMVDTGTIALGNDYIMGLEGLWIHGPLSVQAEYGWNWTDGVIGFNPSGSSITRLATPQNYMFNGGYIQAAYTLTGEYRHYDKRFGTLAREYFGKPGPYENAFALRDECGNWIFGRGAWEIAARYSYLDLNDGAGPNRVQGGIMNGVTLGLNWYLNNNCNVMFDWAYDQRDDLPAATIPGYTSGYGARVQFQF